jgi:hypothetical protein
MNERIKELAKEARLLTGWVVGECEYQNFAELIIKECSALANHFSDGHEKDQFGCRMFHYTSDIGQVILEYFGVEE